MSIMLAQLSDSMCPSFVDSDLMYFQLFFPLCWRWLTFEDNCNYLDRFTNPVTLFAVLIGVDALLLHTRPKKMIFEKKP